MYFFTKKSIGFVFISLFMCMHDIHAAAEVCPFKLAICNGQAGDALMLIADYPEKRQKELIRNELSNSFYRISHDSIARLLQEPYFKDIIQGMCMLHSACKHKKMDLVNVLLQGGIDPNACDGDGKTPLHALLKAYTYGDEDCYAIARKLIFKGARSSVLHSELLYRDPDRNTRKIEHFVSLLWKIVGFRDGACGH